MNVPSTSSLLDIAARAVELAQKNGADAADAVYGESLSLAANVRLGELEDIERSESGQLGLRVFVGKAQATISTTDYSDSALQEAAGRAVAMAKVAPEDEYAGLADADDIAHELADLDLFDNEEPAVEALEEVAKSMEAAALDVEGVTNSSGAAASYGVSGVCMVASNGFSGAYRRSGFSRSCSVVAGEGTAMETDYDFSAAVHFDDLEAPEKIGRTAGERAVKRLFPRKMRSCAAPVVFDPRVATNILSNFSGAISGAAIARGTSFLKEALETKIFSDAITIVDDPMRERGLASRPFDGEGIAPETLNLIEGGVLTTWLLDCNSARQLGLRTNGRASRGSGGSPSPSTTNLYMMAGGKTPGELISDISEGFYVTQLMGRGGNSITGDYSNGVAGFWIENGEIAFPVSEMTIAGKLTDMFANAEPANDLTFTRGTNSPTLRIEGMTIAGK